MNMNERNQDIYCGVRNILSQQLFSMNMVNSLVATSGK